MLVGSGTRKPNDHVLSGIYHQRRIIVPIGIRRRSIIKPPVIGPVVAVNAESVVGLYFKLEPPTRGAVYKSSVVKLMTAVQTQIMTGPQQTIPYDRHLQTAA